MEKSVNLTEIWLDKIYVDNDSVVNLNSYLCMLHDIVPVNIEWSSGMDFLFVIFKSNRIAVYKVIGNANISIVQIISDLKTDSLTVDYFGTSFMNVHSQLNHISYDASRGLLVVALWNGDVLLKTLKANNFEEHLSLNEFHKISCGDMTSISKMLVRNKNLIILQKDFYVCFMLISFDCEGVASLMDKCCTKHESAYKITNVIDVTDHVYLIAYENSMIQIVNVIANGLTSVAIEYVYEFKLDTSNCVNEFCLKSNIL